jgi:hypothetical protein
VSEDASCLQAFREQIVERYRYYAPAMGTTEMLRRIAGDEDRAFDLFFEELDLFLVAHPGATQREPARFVNLAPVPVSADLEYLAERPLMYLPEMSVGCLRAELDGHGLAASEDGHPECSDLDGFDHWVRKELGLKGLFRWENAIVREHCGDEAAAYSWAAKELKAYRLSNGPVTVFQRGVLDRKTGAIEKYGDPANTGSEGSR